MLFLVGDHIHVCELCISYFKCESLSDRLWTLGSDLVRDFPRYYDKHKKYEGPDRSKFNSMRAEELMLWPTASGKLNIEV